MLRFNPKAPVRERTCVPDISRGWLNITERFSESSLETWCTHAAGELEDGRRYRFETLLANRLCYVVCTRHLGSMRDFRVWVKQPEPVEIVQETEGETMHREALRAQREMSRPLADPPLPQQSAWMTGDFGRTDEWKPYKNF